MNSPPLKKCKVITHEKQDGKLQNLFNRLNVCLVDQGLGKTRSNILQKQLVKHGGVVATNVTKDTSHILIAAGIKREKLLKLLKLKDIDQNIKVLYVDWLSKCLIQGEIIDDNAFLAFPLDKVESGTPSVVESTNEKTETTEVELANTFVCAKPSTSSGEDFNTYITEKLAVLEKNYTTTQDRWRAFGYKKAIASIRNYHKPLKTYEEVAQLPNVGERLAKKIWEIIETGHLRRLDHIDPKVELLNKFAAVWGAGPKTAEQWVAKGYTSLDDLHKKATLTFQQQIGLKYYDDINEKMHRSEVAEIEKCIRCSAEILLPGVEMIVCGSYRRGREYCGDIDVLVSHPDGKSHTGFLKVLLDELKKEKLITDDLITVENEEQRKYMGVCKLPHESSKFRRIDFIVAPYIEWPLALTHFTGSAHLNRSIRLLAKKKNMSLSEHALRKDVVYGPGDEKLSKGTVVPVFSEEDIFRHLGLDYLQPTERDL